MTDQVLMPGADYQAICNAVRALTGGTAALKSGDIAGALQGVTPAKPVYTKAINFYDYDGNCVAAWSLEELAGKTELPPLPGGHPGLVCQDWNWTLAELKSRAARTNVGAMYITTDGKTRVYITLSHGRLSPMLGLCVNGEVEVDWGDGTAPDTLTGTSLAAVQWTQTHGYARAGSYVITMTVKSGGIILSGQNNEREGMYLLRHSPDADVRNAVYQAAVKRIELGAAAALGDYACKCAGALTTITIPRKVGIGSSAFDLCRSLRWVCIPPTVKKVAIFAMQNCSSLTSVAIPSGITEIGGAAFRGCTGLASVYVPGGVTKVGGSAFDICHGVRVYDFTGCEAVPTLNNTDAFYGIAPDCEIRVPKALEAQWKAATNWAALAGHIVGV